MDFFEPNDRYQQYHSTPIDSLRVLATLIVFMLHTTIFTKRYVNLWGTDCPAVFLLMTPAWAGVWIFFILSGYLIGKGWVNHRYTFTTKGVFDYYRKRIKRVLLPTWFFIFLCCVIVYPEFVKKYPAIIINFLTLTYNGNPGIDGIGATWYIFSIMQLYLIAPLIFFFVEKISKKSPMFLSLAIIFIPIIGMLYRIMLFKMKVNWSSIVYTPSYSNLDLFISGFLISYFTSNRAKINFPLYLIKKITEKINHSHLKSGSTLLLVALIVYNCWIYFKGQYFIYQYILPSIYIFIVSIYLFIFDFNSHNTGQSLVTNANVEGSKATYLIHFFSNISFEFYLFHSLVLFKITNCFTVTSPISFHLKVMIFAAFFTIILSYGFSRIFKRNVSEHITYQPFWFFLTLRLRRLQRFQLEYKNRVGAFLNHTKFLAYLKISFITLSAVLLVLYIFGIDDSHLKNSNPTFTENIANKQDPLSTASYIYGKTPPISLGEILPSDNTYFHLKLRFRADSTDGYPNVFQTAPVNRGMRMELSNSMAVLIIPDSSVPRGLKGIIITKSLNIGQWYTFEVWAINRSSIRTALDGHLVANYSSAGISIETSEILVGRGFDTTRIFHGQIDNIFISKSNTEL